jgi:lipopolysaccharide export system permease protein
VKKLDLYIAKTVLIHIFVVLMVLLALQTFFALIDEMRQIGRFEFLLLSTPRRMHEILPVSALAGSLLGLGALAGTSELTVMRAAGMSRTSIVMAVLKAGVVLGLFSVLLGEGVMPPMQHKAIAHRSSAIAGRVSSLANGVWLRDQNRLVSVESVMGSDLMIHPRIMHLDADWKIAEIIEAQVATYQEQDWVLKEVVTTRFEEDNIVVTQAEQLLWQTGFGPQIVDLLSIRPDMLTLSGLLRYIRYLDANQTHSKRYWLAFWSKLMAPLSTLVMLLLAAPLAMGHARSTQMGRNLFLGILGGVLLNMLNRMFTNVGMITPLPSVMAATLPTLLFLILAIVLLRRSF